MDYEKFLTRKLVTLFPEMEMREAVIQILGSYGVESHEQESSRVRLAILKLSGSNIEDIKKTTEYAKQDYRDTLAWAEYPRQIKKWSMPDGPKKQKLIKADKKEYEDWLYS